MKSASDSPLVLPLAALFVAFFVAPLCILLALSFSGEAAMRTHTLTHYLTFFSDPYHTSILWQTLLLGVKATLLCLVFGYPIAWLCARSGARLIYMPLHIFQQAIGANNWPCAAAISVIFMVAVLVIVGVLGALGRRSETYARA